MEDILASIRKIITDDGGEARAKPATIRPVPKVVPARPSNDLERALAEASAAPQGAVPDDDILELPAGPAVVAAKPVAVPPPRPVLVVAPKAVPLAPMLVAEKPNVSLQPVLVKPLNSVAAIVPSNPVLQPQRISANPVPLAKPGPRPRTKMVAPPTSTARSVIASSI